MANGYNLKSQTVESFTISPPEYGHSSEREHGCKFSVKYLFREANIAYNFPLLEYS